MRQFQGAPYNFKNAFCTRPEMPPLAVPLFIDWAPYRTAAGNPTALGIAFDVENWQALVSVAATNANANQLAGKQLIDAIRCVKIDNSGSNCPISIVFDDTLDCVTAPPNTVVWAPVVTNGYTFRVFAQNMQTGFVPQTRIFLYNTIIPPLVDPQLNSTYPQELGSATIQRSNQVTPGFGPRALGDQFANAALPVQFIFQTAVFGGVSSLGAFLYITHVDAHFQTVTQNCEVGLFYDGIKLLQFNGGPSAAIGGPASHQVCSMSGMNVRIPNVSSLYLQVLQASASGAIVCNIAYTVAAT